MLKLHLDIMMGRQLDRLMPFWQPANILHSVLIFMLLWQINVVVVVVLAIVHHDSEARETGRFGPLTWRTLTSQNNDAVGRPRGWRLTITASTAVWSGRSDFLPRRVALLTSNSSSNRSLLVDLSDATITITTGAHHYCWCWWCGCWDRRDSSSTLINVTRLRRCKDKIT